MSKPCHLQTVHKEEDVLRWRKKEEEEEEEEEETEEKTQKAEGARTDEEVGEQEPRERQ